MRTTRWYAENEFGQENYTKLAQKLARSIEMLLERQRDRHESGWTKRVVDRDLRRSNRCSCCEFSRVRKLAPNRLDNQSRANRPCTGKNSHWCAVNKCFHPLQVGLELSLGDACRLDTNPSEVLRLSATSNAVTSCGAGSSKKANAWHS